MTLMAAPLTAPASVMAFDFGTQRIGIATGTAILGTGTPLTTLKDTANEARFAAIERLIREWQPQALLVGRPLHSDGQPHTMTERAERFARQLEGRFRLPVHRVDERYTSVEAESLAQGQRGATTDARAAALLVDQYFRAILPSARPCDSFAEGPAP